MHSLFEPAARPDPRRVLLVHESTRSTLCWRIVRESRASNRGPSVSMRCGCGAWLDFVPGVNKIEPRSGDVSPAVQHSCGWNAMVTLAKIPVSVAEAWNALPRK